MTALASARWSAAMMAARLFGADPLGSGIHVRSRPGPVRDRYLSILRNLTGDRLAIVRLPSTISECNLLGGLDLAASLAGRRPVSRRGALASADGAVIVLAGAERLAHTEASVLAEAFETGTTAAATGDPWQREAARFGLIVLDEGDDDEQIASILSERMPMRIELDEVCLRDTTDMADIVPGATASGSDPVAADEPLWVETLVDLAARLGIASLRAPLQAARVARISATQAGRVHITSEDIARATHLVYAHRATRLPTSGAPEPSAVPPERPDREPAADAAGPQPDTRSPPPPRANAGSGDDAITPIPPALASIPDELLRLAIERSARRRGKSGRGTASLGFRRGRPIGTVAGLPGGGARIDLAATLRAAAPWQTIRRREPGSGTRLLLRAGDTRIRRFEEQKRRVTIFLVDASGSAASQRLAEAKGAVELLLAECYRRRDQVALIAFRGRQAEIVLPPTGALARARRCLSGLPGGGGTPLALGLDAASTLCASVARRGETPFLVLLTDGRANVDRNGYGGRAQAERDALASAALFRGQHLASILIDISPRPNPAAAAISAALGGRYIALPLANAARLGVIIRAASA